MPEIQVFGQETGIDRRFLPLVVIGAGVAAYLIFRPRAATTVPSFSVPESDIEFARITEQANDQLNRLNAMTALEQRMIDTQFQINAGLTPGLLRQCVPYEKWWNLDGPTRQGIQQQVRNGSMLMSATAQGFCFTPTTMGVAGVPAPVRYTQKQGFFTSRETLTGPAGYIQPQQQPLGPPEINQLVDALLQLYADHGVSQISSGTPKRARRKRTGPAAPSPNDPGINPYPLVDPNDPRNYPQVFWSDE
jgi:hypothetical protein